MMTSHHARRTLIRIHAVDRENNTATICLPAWNPYIDIEVSLEIFPQNIHDLLAPDIRLFGYVNTTAGKAEDLIFEYIEDQLHESLKGDL